MLNLKVQPRVTSFAPQFLVEDLVRSMTYYQKLGFTFGDPWDGFYVIGELDGLELHLKEAPKNAAERQLRREHEHLDAAAGVDGIEAYLRPVPRERRDDSQATNRDGVGYEGLLYRRPRRLYHRVRRPAVCARGVARAAMPLSAAYQLSR